MDKATLEKRRKALKFKDPGIFEKTMYAFNLLTDLIKFYPDLIFKGGTSLLLHVFPPVRFSIDIDILLHKKHEKSLEENLSRLVSESSVFNLLKEDERESDIPKAHYKFYYDSHFARNEQYVLLDVVFCEHPYHKVVDKKLEGHQLSIANTSAVVKIPTVEGLFGDKLTAISPKTIGIPLNQKREMEFVKQIVDLGMLFDMLDDFEDIKKTFIKNSKQENTFRKTKYTIDEVLEDILDIAFKYSQYLLKGANNSLKEIEHINGGLTRISNHLVVKYGQTDLKLAFAKIAYMCMVIKGKEDSKIIKDVDFSQVEGRSFQDGYRLLEGLKKTNPEAYFYWLLEFGESSRKVIEKGVGKKVGERGGEK